MATKTQKELMLLINPSDYPEYDDIHKTMQENAIKLDMVNRTYIDDIGIGFLVMFTNEDDLITFKLAL